MNTQLPSKRLTLIGLNEFSVDLLTRGAKELQLKNIDRLLSMRSATTTTDDMVEHRGLDPWVQWVSVHTGVPSSVHGIIHLGDTPSALSVSQVWETLSDAGISSGIWGAMNATREGARHCDFFLPDPWTFSEVAYPDELNDLLSLPRYYSKNYLDVSKQQFLACTGRLVKFILGSGAVLKLFKQIPFVLGGVLRNGINNALLFSLFDLFSAEFFVKYKKRYTPQFSLVFLNSIAHLQHHRWDKDKLSKDSIFGLRAIDRVLGMIFAAREKDEAIIVMNALTQRNIVGEKPCVCYRQINPQHFLSAVGIQFRSVEQLMTNDAHVFFHSEAERDAAARALEAATLCGKPLFHVEKSSQDPNKLFYLVDFWDELDGEKLISVNDIEIKYFEHFEAIVARTGAHIRTGNVYYEGMELPDQLYNHEMAERILNYFSVAQASVRDHVEALTDAV
ncbi:alkaline phosphatase family protein [Dyella sp. 2HG41-7]|uniref:alkaline phosphatase family protein n=1 Tax=Dyella sp. 2HG41-7 TaxID=2883239 RepID=UPI001F20BA6D|nr:alkaline phosphatase family protein [Dyella sp. 2HG41-7]